MKMNVGFVVGGIKAEPTEIKIESNQEPVEITAEDVCDINEIEQERNHKQKYVVKAWKISYNPQIKPKIQTEYQKEGSCENTFNAKETLLVNFTSEAEENQSSSESVIECVELPTQFPIEPTIEHIDLSNESPNECVQLPTQLPIEPGIKPDWAALYRVDEYGLEKKDMPQIIPAPLTCISESEYTVLGPKQWQCNHCKATTKLFSSIKILREHIRRVHRDQQTLYKCRYCPYTSKCSSYLMKMHVMHTHKNKNDVKFFECYTCGYKFKLKQQLVKHVQSHMSIEELLLLEKVHRCPHCPKIYRLKECLNVHIDIHHGDGQGKYSCKQCNMKFKIKQSLINHIQKRHKAVDELETLKCTKCDFSTKFITTLYRHRHRSHRSPLQCEKCAFQSRNLPAFKLHEMTHKNLEDHEMKYKCKECDYKTYRQYSLQIHKLNHLKPEEIQYFYCYFCNFKAKRKDNLKTHVLRHFKQEEVHFGCYLCDFSTKKRQILIDHISEHSNKKQQ